MKRQARQAVLVQIIEDLNESGSWSGETHIQKAVFFLQEMFEAPLGFDFVLYKYGPFSFDLRDELSAMRADRLARLESQLPPYGPSFVADVGAHRLKERFPVTARRYSDAIRFVAERFDERDVSSLERLATALWVTRRERKKDEKARAKRIRTLKPHVGMEEAREAVREVDRWLREATT